MTSQAINDLPDPTTVPTAGFVPRLGAALIDMAILGPTSYGLYYFMKVQPNIYLIVLIWLVNVLYKPVLESVLGYTVGKGILRLRVVDRGTNRNISFEQSLLRYLPWAVAQFVTLFVYVRFFQSAQLAEVADYMSFTRTLATFPLNENFFITTGNSFPVFSSVWLLTDPWNRALHDRWAQTFVIRQVVAGPDDAGR